MRYEWSLKSFNTLTGKELYALLRLRAEVFVVEQNCVFLDADDKDQDCAHLMGWTTGDDEPPVLQAYARLLPPGLAFEEPSIGRVVTAPACRGTGLGLLLMEKALEELHNLYGQQPVRIGAQHHLVGFYGSLGFEPIGEVYLEDNIPHVEMVKK